MLSLLLAIVLGVAFGATLDRVGATDPTLIGRMLNLSRLHLMKTILLAIGTGSILMFGGQMAGIVDVGHMSVKSAYAGVFIGGLLLGAGWALSGFCPGTGVCAMASGRRDGLSFVAGGLVGAAAYTLGYPAWKASGLLDDIAGGKVTLGTVPGSSFEGLTALQGDIVGMALGAAFVLIAFILPERLTREGEPLAHPAE